MWQGWRRNIDLVALILQLNIFIKGDTDLFLVEMGAQCRRVRYNHPGWFDIFRAAFRTDRVGTPAEDDQEKQTVQKKTFRPDHLDGI
jgi:hypothetical protein